MSKYEELLDIINNSRCLINFYDDGAFRINYAYSNEYYPNLGLLIYYSFDDSLTVYSSALENQTSIDETIINSLLVSFFEKNYKSKPKIIDYC